MDRGGVVPESILFGFRYLLSPLQKWEEEWDSGLHKASGNGSVAKPVLVMLVDALDEADHDNRGTLPVALLLAKE